MNHWRLAAGTRWLDPTTLAGGAPYRVMRLTKRGAQIVHTILALGDKHGLTPAQRELFDRLEAGGLVIPPPPEAATVLDVTVVIPARSAPDPVRRILAVLPPSVAVVVVDDGSPIPLPGALQSQPNLTILRHASPQGPAAARNAGAASADTTWLLFLDADVQPRPDTLPRLLGFATGRDVAVVAPRVVNRPGPGLASWFESSCALDQGPHPANVGQGQPVSYVPSACLVVKTAVFRDAGGFSEEMHVGEDVDLIWRLADHGRIRYEPSVVVTHEPRTRILAALNRRRFYGTSAASLSRRHPGKVRHADVSVWSLVPWVVAVGVSPPLGAAMAVAAVLAAPRGLPSLEPRHARQLAATGQVTAAAGLGRWLIRPLLPVTVALALAVPPLRRRLALAALAGVADLAWRSHKQMATGSVRQRTTRVAGTVVASLLDDVAYSLGVWQGALNHRTIDPLLPTVRDLPGRS
jgi:mycofactocin system glycosyltransferase